MAEENKTSAAKDVQLSSYQQTVLDRQAAIRERYNDASQGREQTRGTEIEGRDSDQVKSQASQPHLRPSGPGRSAVDGQAHNQEMAKDDAAAKALNQKYLERYQKIKDANEHRNDVNSNDGNYKD